MRPSVFLPNLIRLLVALPPADRQRLAALWQVDPAAPSTQVPSLLYRHLTDAWWLKWQLESLPTVRRLVLARCLARPGRPLTARSLAIRLPLTPQAIADHLAALAAVGLLWPVPGTTTTGPDRPYYLPVDLARALARLRGQRRGPDRSRLPLRRWLRLLPLPVLRQAAALWGLSGTTITARWTLVADLDFVLGNRARVQGALATLPPEARTLYQALLTAERRLPVRHLRRTWPHPVPALRTAFQTLAERLLIGETYAEGDWLFFIPPEVATRTPPTVRPPASPTPPALTAVPAPARVLRPPPRLDLALNRLPDILADRPLRLTQKGQPPLPALRRLGQGQVERGALLVHLARSLGLLEAADDRLVLTPRWADWRRLPTARQREVILRAWLADPHWGEAPGGGPPLPALLRPLVRRDLCRALATAAPDTWYGLTALAAQVQTLVAQRYPVVIPATGRAGSGPSFEPLLEAMLDVLHGLGLVALGADPTGRLVAVQVTPEGRSLLRELPEPPAAPSDD